jgi:hypothetical protein
MFFVLVFVVVVSVIHMLGVSVVCSGMHVDSILEGIMGVSHVLLLSLQVA